MKKEKVNSIMWANDKVDLWDGVTYLGMIVATIGFVMSCTRRSVAIPVIDEGQLKTLQNTYCDMFGKEK